MMALIDQQYLKTPFYGSRRMTQQSRTPGQPQAGPPAAADRTGVPTPASQTQGIRSIRLAQGAGDPGQPGVGHRHHLHTHGSGFPLLGALDSTAWLSNTLEVDFCVAALEGHKGRPQIFNRPGQPVHQRGLHAAGQGVQVSMDGRGRCMDNGTAVAQIGTTEVYLKAYQNGTEARKGIGAYLAFYNQERPHQALGYRSPGQVFHAVSPQRCLLEHPQALPSDEGLRDTPAVDSLILASPAQR